MDEWFKTTDESFGLETTFDEADPLHDLDSVFAEYGQTPVDFFELKPRPSVLDVAVGAGAVLLPAARQVGPRGHARGLASDNRR